MFICDNQEIILSASLSRSWFFHFSKQPFLLILRFGNNLFQNSSKRTYVLLFSSLLFSRGTSCSQLGNILSTSCNQCDNKCNCSSTNPISLRNLKAILSCVGNLPLFSDANNSSSISVALLSDDKLCHS